MPQAYPKRKGKGEQTDPHCPFPWCSTSQPDPSVPAFPNRIWTPTLPCLQALRRGQLVLSQAPVLAMKVWWDTFPQETEVRSCEQNRRLHDCLTWNARYQGKWEEQNLGLEAYPHLYAKIHNLAYAECFFPASISPCAHPFVPRRRFILYFSSGPNILDSKNMWWQVLYILLRYSHLIPFISLFFPRLSCSCMFYWHWKVWRYWLHISFWHTTKCAISCLHTGDWLTWQVSHLGRKHIKIALHAAVVFNRNIIQLTQVFFRRFFFISLNAEPSWILTGTQMFLEAAVAQLAVLAVLKVFYPEISGHGEASKWLSSAMYLATKDQSFIT